MKCGTDPVWLICIVTHVGVLQPLAAYERKFKARPSSSLESKDVVGARWRVVAGVRSACILQIPDISECVLAMLHVIKLLTRNCKILHVRTEDRVRKLCLRSIAIIVIASPTRRHHAVSTRNPVQHLPSWCQSSSYRLPRHHHTRDPWVP